MPDSPRQAADHLSRATPASALRTSQTLTGAGVVVRVSGEIDLDCAERFRAALDGAALAAAAQPDPAARRVWADTTGVTFCDSAGLHALICAREDCLDRGPAFVLVPGKQVARLLDLTGTTSLFTRADQAPAVPVPRAGALT
jgi:anti-anti-sigma factor